jgi:hypothetical protein
MFRFVGEVQWAKSMWVAVQAKFYFHDAMQSTVNAPTYTKINAIADGCKISYTKIE